MSPKITPEELQRRYDALNAPWPPKRTMKTIYKYILNPETVQSVIMPQDAKILSVQVQHGQICIWAVGKASGVNERRIFHVYGTGHELPDDELSFIGTVQLHGGALVFHVFEAL